MGEIPNINNEKTGNSNNSNGVEWSNIGDEIPFGSGEKNQISNTIEQLNNREHIRTEDITELLRDKMNLAKDVFNNKSFKTALKNSFVNHYFADNLLYNSTNFEVSPLESDGKFSGVSINIAGQKNSETEAITFNIHSNTDNELSFSCAHAGRDFLGQKWGGREETKMKVSENGSMEIENYGYTLHNDQNYENGATHLQRNDIQEFDSDGKMAGREIRQENTATRLDPISRIDSSDWSKVPKLVKLSDAGLKDCKDCTQIFFQRKETPLGNRMDITENVYGKSGLDRKSRKAENLQINTEHYGDKVLACNKATYDRLDWKEA